jgi:hypothetical protein
LQAAEQEAAAEAARAAKRAKKTAFDKAYDTGGAKAVDDTAMADPDGSNEEGSEDGEDGEGEDWKVKKRGKGWARYSLTSVIRNS